MAPSLPPAPQVLHEDRAALSAWAGAVTALLVCAGFSIALLRFGWEDIPVWPGAGLGVYPPWVLPFLLVISWLGGVGYASWALTRARLRVEIGDDGHVLVTRRYPFREKTVTVAATAAWLVECTDDEGEVRFRAEVPKSGGGHVVLAEFGEREACQAFCRRYNSVLGLEGRGWARGGDR